MRRVPVRVALGETRVTGRNSNFPAGLGGVSGCLGMGRGWKDVHGDVGHVGAEQVKLHRGALVKAKVEPAGQVNGIPRGEDEVNVEGDASGDVASDDDIKRCL